MRSHDLKDFQCGNRPRVEIDPLLKRAGQPGLVERYDPPFFDDQLFDDAAADERRAADGRVLPPRRAALNETACATLQAAP